MNAPCQDCPERAGGCHTKCGRYARFRAERDQRLHEKLQEVLIREARSTAVERSVRPGFMKRKRRGRT